MRPDAETQEQRDARVAWEHIAAALAVDPARTFTAEYRARAELHAPIAPTDSKPWTGLV
jgi:hypothetical protein